MRNESKTRHVRVACTLALLVCAAQPASAAGAPSHFPNTLFHDGMENLADGPSTDADAARFLAQATFGPTDADIAHLRSVGYQGWLAEQFAAAPSLMLTYYNWVSGTLGERTDAGTTLREAWFLGALGGPDPQNNLIIHRDQLRQRVAFALSEIFVVSNQNTKLDQNPDGLAWYYDILTQNAFGSFRTLLEKVTLSPAMGVYLNMQGNQRADLSKNLYPDENYAREINQLFSVGLEMLNADGTPKLSQGKPIPTYTQQEVTTFAHVFTGWNWASCGLDNFDGCGDQAGDFVTPMTPNAEEHDDGTDPVNDIVTKHLLAYPNAVNGGVLAAGGTPQSDLAFALDNIFNHPNVGPFIGKQLIQRLVTSNPSPQYVQRVSAVFGDDGTAGHARGNLKAVVQAILMDPEARIGHFANPTSYGKLREPLLRVTHFWRAMGARHACGQTINQGDDHFSYDNPYRYAGYTTAWSVNDSVYGSGVGQAPLNADSVFNFFKPSYLPPGEMTTAALLGPEFQINTDSLATVSTTSINSQTWSDEFAQPCRDVDTPFGNVKPNRAQDFALAGSANGGVGDPADRLVDAYSMRFMSGQMSPFMRQTLLSYINPIGGANFRDERIRRALLVILTSPEYMVQK